MNASTTTGATLEVDNLARRFGPRWALAAIRFQVPAGGSLLLTGPNGSGKTTLLRCLSTALRPHAGTVKVDGLDLWRERGVLRPRIGFLSHQTRLYEDLSATENVHTWASLGGHRVDAKELLERVGIPTNRRDAVRTYSAGMRRRVALALALIREPSLMLLDEPLSALDVEGRALIVKTVQELRDRGVTIVIASHLPTVTAPLADEALRLESGRIVWSGPASAVVAQ